MKISITLDVSKINKDKIIDRKYTNRTGAEVTVKEYKIEAVPRNDQVLIKDGGTYRVYKSHLIYEAQTKEERASKVKGVVVGDGFTFEFQDNKPKDVSAVVQKVEKKDDMDSFGIDYDAGEVNLNDIPF